MSENCYRLHPQTGPGKDLGSQAFGIIKKTQGRNRSMLIYAPVGPYGENSEWIAFSYQPWSAEAEVLLAKSFGEPIVIVQCIEKGRTLVLTLERFLVECETVYVGVHKSP